jgi:hypothetical protein
MRNLIEPEEGDYIGRYMYTMHDVVCSFAELVAREDLLLIQDHHCNDPESFQLKLRIKHSWAPHRNLGTPQDHFTNLCGDP